ncbi:MAG: NADH-quinone oxidoreductase subunit NuoK [Spirosomataceae bacterium]
MIPLSFFLLVSAVLFSVGLAIALVKKQAIFVLMGIELMLNAANLNFIAFSQYDPQRFQGQFFSLMVMVVAAAEVTVALSIIIRVYQHYQTTQLEKLDSLKN